MESVGFKEWAIVCEALGHGQQNIILRKGGIAEGRAGFSFRHKEFFLFPTWFHEQITKVRGADFPLPKSHAAEIEIKYFARIQSSQVITSWRMVEQREPFHVLQPDVVRERFDYDKAPGLHVAFVRTFRANPAWRLANEKRYGGCRSWLQLPESPANLRFEPVLTDSGHEKLRRAFDAITEPVANPESVRG